MTKEGKQNAPSPPARTQAGYVALIGLPNAGKSSLVNALLDQKLSIVTPLAQTTRERVIGIETRGSVQMIFVDTPGLVTPQYLLHRSMVQTAMGAVPDADVILLIVDAMDPPPELGDEVADLLQKRRASLVVVVNKVDIAPADAVARARLWAEQRFECAVEEVSALQGTGIDELRQRIVLLLPASPFLYPPDEISSQPVRFFVAEFIREAAFGLYRQEVPYSVAVQVEEFREEVVPMRIRATIYVERSSQKAILIGRGGSGIRTLGEEARHKIETFLGTRIHLELWVKVLPRWRKDPVSLKRLGYSVPPTER